MGYLTFAFEEQVLKILKTKKANLKENIKESRGVTIPKFGLSYINLSANQWKQIKNESDLIKQLCETIIHENVHSEIEQVRKTMYVPLYAEEKVAQVLAEQDRGLLSVK